MRRLREQDGIALITATIIITVVMGLSLALLSFSNAQQHASGREQNHEMSYQLAEAALNQQISKLGAQWATSSEWTAGAPTSCTPTGGVYPSGCECDTSSTFTGCPGNANGWQNSYTTTGSSWCPPGTLEDAWGATTKTTTWSNVNNGWWTYVRDNGTWSSTDTSKLFSSTADQGELPYDANGDGNVWVRSAATYHCQTSVVLSKVAEQLIPISFPRYGVTANAFATGNNGNKVILDTSGTNAQPSNPNSSPGKIGTRCNGVSANCASYRAGAQISADTCGASATAPGGCTDFSSTPVTSIDSTGLLGLKAEAEAYGTWYSASASDQANGAKACPTSASQLNSVAVPGGVAPVYLDTSCPSLSFTGNSTINSATQPGFLVLTTQTLYFGGTVNFYGFIYDANLCLSGSTYSTCTTYNSSTPTITITGNAAVQGAINVDGGGWIQFGQSKYNFIYDSRVWNYLTEFGGADAAPNSFRQLPVTG